MSTRHHARGQHTGCHVAVAICVLAAIMRGNAIPLLQRRNRLALLTAQTATDRANGATLKSYRSRQDHLFAFAGLVGS